MNLAPANLHCSILVLIAAMTSSTRGVFARKTQWFLSLHNSQAIMMIRVLIPRLFAVAVLLMRSWQVCAELSRDLVSGASEEQPDHLAHFPHTCCEKLQPQIRWVDVSKFLVHRG